jgi:hypothetical protein
MAFLQVQKRQTDLQGDYPGSAPGSKNRGLSASPPLLYLQRGQSVRLPPELINSQLIPLTPMAESKKLPVGVIGLGIIGSRVAAALRRSGYPVSWSGTAPRVPSRTISPRPAKSPEVADVLQLFVRDGEALLQVDRIDRPRRLGNRTS